LPFCRGVTRARLSADGTLYTCVFAGPGHDLRGSRAPTPPAWAPEACENFGSMTQ